MYIIITDGLNPLVFLKIHTYKRPFDLMRTCVCAVFFKFIGKTVGNF